MIYHVSLVRHGDGKLIYEDDIGDLSLENAKRIGLCWRYFDDPILGDLSDTMVIVEWKESVWRA